MGKRKCWLPGLVVLLLLLPILPAQADEGVLFQGFYWDPEVPAEVLARNPNMKWLEYVEMKVGELKAAGVTAIWIPSPVKGFAGDDLTMRSLARPTLDRDGRRADHVAYRSPCCAMRTDGGRTCPLDRNPAVSTSLLSPAPTAPDWSTQ